MISDIFCGGCTRKRGERDERQVETRESGGGKNRDKSLLHRDESSASVARSYDDSAISDDGCARKRGEREKEGVGEE